MKRAIALLIGILWLVSMAMAEEPAGTIQGMTGTGESQKAEERAGTIQSMTELGEIQKKLDQGVTIEKVYYTDGYGFSTSEFSTEDPEEIRQLWESVNAIVVGEKVDESITDWYPQIVFYLSDGTYGGARFEATWLNVGGMNNYEISNAEEFRSLTSMLVQKYEDMKNGAWPGGGSGFDTDRTGHDTDRTGNDAGQTGHDTDRTVVTAVAAEINPENLVSVAADAEILFCDDSKCFLTIFVPERYRPDDMIGLKPGDAIYTQGREVSIQTISEMDGNIVLNADTDEEIRLYESADQYYRIAEGKGHTWTEFETVRVPISGRLLFLDGMDPATGEILVNPAVHNRADFLAMMASQKDPGFENRIVTVAFDELGELALIFRYADARQTPER